MFSSCQLFHCPFMVDHIILYKVLKTRPDWPVWPGNGQSSGPDNPRNRSKNCKIRIKPGKPERTGGSLVFSGLTICSCFLYGFLAGTFFAPNFSRCSTKYMQLKICVEAQGNEDQCCSYNEFIVSFNKRREEFEW